MAWINDRELLNLEDARVLLRENLKTQGIMCKNDEKLSDLVTKVLSVQSWLNFVKKRLVGEIIDRETINLSTGFNSQDGITAFYFPLLTTVAQSNLFNSCANCKIYCFPRLSTNTNLGAYRPSTVIMDMGVVNNVQIIGASSAPNFAYLILRKSDSIATLPNTNYFDNTPFSSDGGKLYVPNNLVTNYEEGTNWSSLLGMTVIGLTGSRFEALDWFEKRDGVVTLDGNEIEIIEDETVEMFKYTENLDAIYEDGVELDDDELMAGHRIVTSEVE